MDLWRRWWSLEKQRGGREVLIAIGSSPVLNILCIIILLEKITVYPLKNFKISQTAYVSFEYLEQSFSYCFTSFLPL